MEGRKVFTHPDASRLFIAQNRTPERGDLEPPPPRREIAKFAFQFAPLMTVCVSAMSRDSAGFAAFVGSIIRVPSSPRCTRSIRVGCAASVTSTRPQLGVISRADAIYEPIRGRRTRANCRLSRLLRFPRGIQRCGTHNASAATRVVTASTVSFVCATRLSPASDSSR